MKSGGAKPELNAVAIQGAAVLRPYQEPYGEIHGWQERVHNDGEDGAPGRSGHPVNGGGK